MTWEAEFTEEFETWWASLTEDQQERVTAAVEVLESAGPSLGRPLVDRIASSRYPNMKELRVSEQGDLRILFAFGPVRTPILLLGGNKSGQWDEWYKSNTPVADVLYDQYIDELRKEGRLK